MNIPWQSEIRRIAGLLVITLLIALLSGSYLLPFSLAILGYLAWHLYNLTRLLRWLRLGKGYQPPESSGIWDEVFESLQRLLQRNNKRKKNLRRQLKRFHKMVAALPDAAVELRADGDEIEWWNDAASRFLGLQYPRDVGQRIGNLLRHPDLQQYCQVQDYEEAVEIPAPVDENRILRIRIIPYSGNRRLLLARDMTRIRLLERTRKDFVANASHELRSPLTVLSGYLETLQDDDACSEIAPQLHSMQAQTDRMTHIVDDLMLLSRLESEAPRVDAQPVNVPVLLRRVTEQAKALSGPDEHEFVTDIDDRLCLHGRESELYSAFSNLLFNAVRYTPSAGRIELVWQDTDEGPVFSVSDTGVGIAPQHLPRLTERFYRVDAGRSRATGGTGLGLAIVKHVLQRHRAHLEIESNTGSGSIFTCRFDPDRRRLCQTQ